MGGEVWRQAGRSKQPWHVSLSVSLLQLSSLIFEFLLASRLGSGRSSRYIACRVRLSWAGQAEWLEQDDPMDCWVVDEHERRSNTLYMK